MSARLAHVIEEAINEGILPPGTTFDTAPERPWPVVLLTALGAWLAALPLLAGLYMLIGEDLFRGIGSYVIGAIALAAAVALLRMKALPLFIEQLGVPLLLTGGLALGLSLDRDLPRPLDGAVLSLATLAIAWLIKQPWLRTVLGAAACALGVTATGVEWSGTAAQNTLFGLVAAVALWCLSQWLPRRQAAEASTRAALAAVADGWVVAALAGLAFWSGMTFLAGASIDPGGAGGQAGASFGLTAQLVSLLLAVGAAAGIARQWPSLRQPWSAAAALVVVVLAWLMPSLGAVMLVLAVCATQGRWGLAAVAGLAAAWIIGAFYYQLAYPLATKALIMLGAGAVFGGVAWMASGTRGAASGAPAARPDPLHARLAIAACALAVLAVANIGIWQKETLIAEGKPVFVELGPVDPRSLMQGDYMRLAFDLPPDTRDEMSHPRATRSPLAIGKSDARGIVTLERMDDGRPLAPGEIAIQLKRMRNGWILVTDAWYFREGDAARWERAKYGEFRVTPGGRALLVGMRGPDLEPLLTP